MGNAKKGRKRKSGLEGRNKKLRRRRAKGYREGGRNSGRRTKKDGKSGKELKKKGANGCSQ